MLGLTQTEIAAELGVVRQTVNEWLAKASRVYRETARASIVTERGRQLREIGAATREAFDAWRASKQPTVLVASSPAGQRRTVIRRPNGDARILAQLVKLMERKARLLGLDQPIEMRAVVEEREAGMRLVLDVLTQEIGDADLLDRIASRLEQISEQAQSVASDYGDVDEP